MKRGLITWKEEEIPRGIFESRLGRARAAASKVGAAALVVYSDVWRSNQVRFLSNFMPYWNRSLLVVPLEGSPILLCGLSPRVYPWIRSVTILEDVRPAKRPAQTLLELAAERTWTRIGVVDGESLPYEVLEPLRRSDVAIVSVDSSSLFAPDEIELTVRRTAAGLTRRLVEEHAAGMVGREDRELVSVLERAFRRAGFEDLHILVSDGASVPRPARGTPLTEHGSIAASAEYRGHWAEATRPLDPDRVIRLDERFRALLADRAGWEREGVWVRELSGPHPRRAVPPGTKLPRGSIVSVHIEDRSGGRVFYGDSCLLVSGGTGRLL